MAGGSLPVGRDAWGGGGVRQGGRERANEADLGLPPADRSTQILLLKLEEEGRGGRLACSWRLSRAETVDGP